MILFKNYEININSTKTFKIIFLLFYSLTHYQEPKKLIKNINIKNKKGKKKKRASKLFVSSYAMIVCFLYLHIFWEDWNLELSTDLSNMVTFVLKKNKRKEKQWQHNQDIVRTSQHGHIPTVSLCLTKNIVNIRLVVL